MDVSRVQKMYNQAVKSVCRLRSIGDCKLFSYFFHSGFLFILTDKKNLYIQKIKNKKQKLLIKITEYKLQHNESLIFEILVDKSLKFGSPG